MTCIVGVVDEQGRIYMGGDSAGSAGHDLRIRRDEKVFLRKPFIYGYTSSFRMGQILRYLFVPPPRDRKQSVYEYIYGPWITEVRRCFKEHGYMRIENNVESGGTFLVGYEGHLFEVEGDYQVGEHPEGYSSVGCGGDYALGALYTLSDSVRRPRDLVLRALETAEYFSGGVRRPFVVKSL